jgi:protein tyrosine/serine phosphatase
MTTVLEPPFVVVEGISNFRSIGGYPVVSSSFSRSTRHNFIYRSADPSYITPTGRSTIKSLGITTVYDLRSQPEVDKQLAKDPSSSDPLADRVTRCFNPVFSHEDWSPEAAAERHELYADESGSSGYVQVYTEILEKGGEAFRRILVHVRDRPHEALLCHCSAGKDRTGVAIAILMKLAGCEDEVVAKEYELTEVGLAARREYILQYLMTRPELKGDREKAGKIVGAK